MINIILKFRQLFTRIDLESRFSLAVLFLNTATTFSSLSSETTKENLGIIVQYKVKVRVNISGPLGGELTAELPFTLTHPKPLEDTEERSVC